MASRQGSERRSTAEARSRTMTTRRVEATVDEAASSTRPRTHDRSTQVEQGIFEATQRLLTTNSARDVSVAHIIEEAGVSRATFYHYFSSKWEVVNTLASTVMANIFEHVQQYLTVDESVNRQEALRRSIVEGCEVWANNRAVLRAIVEHWREVPELGAMLAAILEPFRLGIAAELDRERAAGLAPQGPDSNQLVGALLWSSLSCLHVAGLAEVEEIPDEETVARLLITIWMGALYGDPPVLPDTAAGQASGDGSVVTA
jgi:AcrR family transcriptional regulator